MKWIVYTDLDGTLLDHDTYRYDEALPALNSLLQQGCDVVIVTSKTRAEVMPLWLELGLRSPFVIENGSAVYAPVDSPWVQDDWQRSGSWAFKAFAPTLENWQPIFDRLEHHFSGQFERFTELNRNEIAQRTGLSQAYAALAAIREFSDPIGWCGSASQQDLFIQQARQLGCDVVAGGRFIHLLKGSDKGRAVSYINTIAAKQFAPEPVSSLALGDGGNDIAMLEAVDYPVRVRSTHHDFPEVSHINLYSTTGVGPAGWAEAVRKIILSNRQTEERG